MVSIIIPCYHSKEVLPKALDSLVAQTKNMFMVTLVNDCDGEDYTDIIEEYRDRRGLNLYYVETEKNGGPGMARQKGLDLSGMCDYIMFLDSDDMLMPRAVEILYREAKHNNADLVSGSFIIEENNGPGRMAISTRDSITTWVHGKIYKRAYLESIKLRFPEGLRLNEDAYFNLVAVNCANKHARLEEPLAIWRDNRNSLTRSGEDKNAFFKKSHAGYIQSQVMGIEKIIEVTGTISAGLAAATMINVYKHMQLARYLEFTDHEPMCREWLGKLKVNEVFQKSVVDIAFWEEIKNELPACMENDGALFFFKDRFIDWFSEYVEGEEIKESEDKLDDSDS